MDATDATIEDAARELDLNPNVFRKLFQPSPRRPIPVRLDLLGGASIFVRSHESAQDLARIDGAFSVIRVARAAHAGRCRDER